MKPKIMHEILGDNSDDSLAKPVVPRQCSMCGKSFVPSNAAFLPFCSQRCQQLDLIRWLNESYGLPWVDPDKPDLLDTEPDDE
jgi:endogenous inhibitor of DNA gyrase (YacG/DUF329 family)